MSARDSYLATITGATARADQLIAALRAHTGPVDLRRLAIAAQSALLTVQQLEAAPRREDISPGPLSHREYNDAGGRD